MLHSQIKVEVRTTGTTPVQILQIVLVLTMLGIFGCTETRNAADEVPGVGRGIEERPAGDLAAQMAQAVDGRLAVRSIAISDADLETVSKFAQWRELDFSGADSSKISSAGIAQLRNQALLEALVLGEMPLTDDGLAQLAALPNLHRLNVTGTRLTDAGCKALADMEALVQLRLGAAGVTGEGLAHLKQRNLDWLILVEMHVDERGAAELCEMPSLKSLYLVDCDVSDSVREQLERSIPHVH